MIQAQYNKVGICSGCGRQGTLHIRAEAFIDGLRQSESVRLCLGCLTDAWKTGWKAWPAMDDCKPNTTSTIFGAQS